MQHKVATFLKTAKALKTLFAGVQQLAMLHIQLVLDKLKVLHTLKGAHDADASPSLFKMIMQDDTSKKVCFDGAAVVATLRAQLEIKVAGLTEIQVCYSAAYHSPALHSAAL